MLPINSNSAKVCLPVFIIQMWGSDRAENIEMVAVDDELGSKNDSDREENIEMTTVDDELCSKYDSDGAETIEMVAVDDALGSKNGSDRKWRDDGSWWGAGFEKWCWRWELTHQWYYTY